MSVKTLCVIVPFRDRQSHLEQFIPSIKNALKEQNVRHSIYIIEQSPEKSFNRAKLLNVGFDFTQGFFDYYVFHDVDMLPIETDYGYIENPVHLASRCSQFGWKLPYDTYFGGVTLFDRESFVKVNGYSNEYLSYGGEDDDMFNRCKYYGIKTGRKNCSFESLPHERNINPVEYQKIIEKLQRSTMNPDYSIDGLNSLSYKLLNCLTLPDYTKITVEI